MRVSLGLVFTILLLGTTVSGCIPGGPEITDEVVVKYIKAYNNLRKIAPELANRMSKYSGQGEPDAAAGLQGYAELEKAVQEAGFKDMPEFVQVNAKIAWAFNYLQAQRGMSRFQKMQDIGMQEFDKALANPDVPESTKAELRKAKEKAQADYAKNKKWADLTMSGVKLFSDEKTKAVIERHRKEIESAYTGGIEIPDAEFFGQKLE